MAQPVPSRPANRLLQAIFWTFRAAIWLFLPSIRCRRDRAASGDDFIYNNEDRLLVTLLIINLGYGMFAVGAAGRSRTWDEQAYVSVWQARPVRQRMPDKSSESIAGRPSRRSLTLIPLAYFALSFMLLHLVIIRSGGISTLVSSQCERRQMLAARASGRTSREDSQSLSSGSFPV